MHNLLCEVLNICYEISTKSKADVFFEYSPHINAYMVYYYPNGWSPDVAFEWIEMQASVKHWNLLRTIEKLVSLANELGVS